jgi:hypothetical protein
MPDILGSVSLWGFGVFFGIVGIALLLYWTLDEYRDADDLPETVEGVADRSGSAIVVGASVLLTIGDQLAQVLGQLAGLVDAPVVVGHVVGGILGFAGLQGVLTTTEFVVGFVIVTVVAIAWRVSSDEVADT